MPFNSQQTHQLSAKLDPKNVKSREQSGRSFSFVESWYSIHTANEIFGYDAWDRETSEMRLVSERERNIGKGNNQRTGWGVSYIAKVRVTVRADGDVIVREGTGSGHGIDADLGQAHEAAVKEAESDAMKRALMQFGNPFGLALYDKTRSMVGEPDPSEDARKLIGELEKHTARASLETWGAAQSGEIKKLCESDQNHVRSAYSAHLRTLTSKKEAS